MSFNLVSDIPNLFRKAITDSDAHTVSQFLLNTERELRSCDAEINRLRIAIQSLENRKKGLKNTVERYRSLMSPIRRLPAELLAHIFSFACTQNFINIKNRPPAVDLSIVCGQWRDVALSTAGLWSSLNPYFPGWQGRFPALRRVVLTFMERSGVHPLSLHLDFSCIGSDTETEISSILDILARSRGPWRDVTLVDPEVTSTYLDALLRSTSLSALQEVTIIDSHRSTHHPRLLNLFKHGTSLCTFAILTSRLSNDDSRRFDLPWNQIRTLWISTQRPSPVLSFLAMFPRLETLTVSSIPDDGSHPNYTSHTVKSLTLTGIHDHPEAIEVMLEHLTFPNLTTLEIEGHQRTDGANTMSWGKSFADFLVRSGCSLTSLRLHDLPLRDRQVIEMLELTPTLTTLEIRERWFGIGPHNDLFTRMFLQHFVVAHQSEALHSGRIFLPRLNTVVFKVVQREGLVEQDFFDLVMSRWIPDPDRAKEIGVECLRSIQITMTRGSPPTSSARCGLSSLECFRDAGLWVDIAHK
ncbi:hypothetical protein PM082_010382 [Marasmius tenuissimus]|nr:hypothetical protein PM082_010382 [Marasmius tenuissimus]